MAKVAGNVHEAAMLVAMPRNGTQNARMFWESKPGDGNPQKGRWGNFCITLDSDSDRHEIAKSETASGTFVLTNQPTGAEEVFSFSHTPAASEIFPAAALLGEPYDRCQDKCDRLELSQEDYDTIRKELTMRMEQVFF